MVKHPHPLISIMSSIRCCMTMGILYIRGEVFDTAPALLKKALVGTLRAGFGKISVLG